MERVLSIVWYKVLPAEMGGQKGIVQFMNHLCKYVPLICLCSWDNEIPDASPYRIIPKLPADKLQFFDPLLWRRVAKLIIKEDITHIIVEHPYYGLMGNWLKINTGVKFILHSHNIESQVQQSFGKWWWRWLEKWERRAHQKADLNLFKSKEDMQFAVSSFRLDAGKCLVTPFGITAKEPLLSVSEARKITEDKHGIKPGQKILMFNGTLDYPHNRKALENINRHILPLLDEKSIDYRLIISGRSRGKNPEEIRLLAGHPRVIMAGFADHTEPYYLAADAIIAPATTGGGIKTKIIEALSYHKNVVATRAAARGIDLSLTGRKLLIAENEDWKQFANKIEEAFVIQDMTPVAFFDFFDWDRIAKSVAEKIAAL